LICGGIVRIITLYYHYDRLQLLFGKALTLPQLTDKINNVFEPNSSVGIANVLQIWKFTAYSRAKFTFALYETYFGVFQLRQ